MLVSLTSCLAKAQSRGGFHSELAEIPAPIGVPGSDVTKDRLKSSMSSVKGNLLQRGGGLKPIAFPLASAVKQARDVWKWSNHGNSVRP